MGEAILTPIVLILATYSLYVLFVLAVVFSASWLVFWQLERRCTARRQWVSFKEWGRGRGFKLRTADNVTSPSIIAALCDARVRATLSNKTTMIVQIETPDLSNASAPSVQWNLLVRHGVGNWPDTALRPAHQPTAAIDLLSMQSFPLLGPTERFVVYGVDSAAAREISKSSARSLLPPDVGLILKGDELVLDFSTRPFDPIEFDRMIAVADQIAKHLPSHKETHAKPRP